MLHCFCYYHIQPTSDTFETQTHEYVELGLGQLHHYGDMLDHDTSLVEYSQISHYPMSTLKNEVEPASRERRYAGVARSSRQNYSNT